MAYIILSQAKDFKSEYDDVLFEVYHFPACYRRRINKGDIFIYNQGKQSGSGNIRYYYGTGVVGDIYTRDNGVTYFAELKHCKIFYNNVPIKFDNGEYIEQLGFEGQRSRPNWESSIRKLSESAYKNIINMAGGLISLSSDLGLEETKTYLKDSIDAFYLKENKNALLDIIMYSSQLMKKYGIKVN